MHAGLRQENMNKWHVWMFPFVSANVQYCKRAQLLMRRKKCLICRSEKARPRSEDVRVRRCPYLVGSSEEERRRQRDGGLSRKGQTVFGHREQGKLRSFSLPRRVIFTVLNLVNVISLIWDVCNVLYVSLLN